MGWAILLLLVAFVCAGAGVALICVPTDNLHVERIAIMLIATAFLNILGMVGLLDCKLK